MKLKFTLLFVLFVFFRVNAYSQTYYQGDLDALNTLSQSTGQEYFLNWYNTAPPYWEGVTWWLDVEGNMYRVTGLNLANKNIRGNLVVKDLYYLTTLQCQNNMLKGLTIENCPSLTGLNCAVNQLPISELLKFTYLGLDFAYGPQYAVFEEYVDKPGHVINFSSQADGGNTKFVFRNRSTPGTDGSEIIAVNNTGICPTRQEGVYFCEMVNPKLPNFYSHTANINLFATPAIIIKTSESNNTIVFNLAASSANTPIAVDFGDGRFFHRMIEPDNVIIDGTVKGTQIIKIYGTGINKFEVDYWETTYSTTSVDVTNCPSLEYYKCSNLNLTTLDVSQNPNLTQLNCIYNNLTTLDVSQNPNLTQLNCSYNKLTTLDVSQNPNLTQLNCSHNNLTTQDVSQNPNLTQLNCEINKLTTLNVSQNPNLTVLECGINELTTLNVSQNPNLTMLYCAYNYLTALDVSQNPNLTELECHYNSNLTTLNVSQNINLTRLSCYHNNLTTLDVSQNPNLKALYCEDNKLITMDVSQNTNLEALNCQNNNLTTLDVSQNPNLGTIYCNDNNLTTLNVSQNSNFNFLNCSNNKLTTLDLSQNANLTWLNCYNNSLSSLNVSNNIVIFSCGANKLPISQLLYLLSKGSRDFSYSLQYAVFDEATYSTNLTLDYSAQADGGNTTFVFRNRSNPGTDGTQIVAVNNTGIYTTQGSGVYFCEMVNPKLNHNSFYSYTANTTIDLSGKSSLKSMSLTEALSAPINEENSDLIKIYPNPVVDVINAELSNNYLPASITLYSIDGKQLKKTETTSAITTIDMEDLKRGNYIIEIETAKEKIKRKVVKL